MDASTRLLLNAIDNHLAKCDYAASELWDVLTALRGPDSDELGQKDRTTLPIRAAAFPQLAETHATNWVMCSAHSAFPMQQKPAPAFVPPEDGGHFARHVMAAATVLVLNQFPREEKQ